MTDIIISSGRSGTGIYSCSTYKKKHANELNYINTCMFLMSTSLSLSLYLF